MEAFLESVKNYIKVNGDDETVKSIVLAAIEKCEKETGKAFTTDSLLYSQAVRMIAAEWYDHRGVSTTEQLKELPAPVHVQSILNQIALNSEYEEVAE